MRQIQKYVSALMLAGLLAGCTPSGAATTAMGPTNSSNGTAASVPAATGNASNSSNAGAGSTTAGTQEPVKTNAIDPDILLAEGDGISVKSGAVEAEFNKMLDSLRAQYGAEMVDSALAMLQEQKTSILEQLVRNQMLGKKADELKVALERPEAVAQYDKIMAETIASYGSKAKFEEVLKTAGYTMESYRTEVLTSLRYQAVAEEVTKDVAVTEAEIAAGYEKEKAAIYTKPAGATIYHVFFGEPEDAAAEGKAKEAKQKLDGGAKFEDIAKEYGKDGSAASGGLLGNYPYDTQELGADFMAEAKKLKEGEISAPVKTSFGWHIIMVKDVLATPQTLALTDTMDLEDGQKMTVSENVKAALLNTKKSARLEELFAQWEKEYGVKKYADKIPMNVDVPEGSTTPKGTGSTTP